MAINPNFSPRDELNRLSLAGDNKMAYQNQESFLPKTNILGLGQQAQLPQGAIPNIKTQNPNSRTFAKEQSFIPQYQELDTGEKVAVRLGGSGSTATMFKPNLNSFDADFNRQSYQFQSQPEDKATSTANAQEAAVQSPNQQMYYLDDPEVSGQQKASYGAKEQQLSQNLQNKNAQLPQLEYKGNGLMSINLGDNTATGGKNFISSTDQAGMARIAQGFASRGGLSSPPPQQSAAAQAAGTTDFWLNQGYPGGADQYKAARDLKEQSNAQQQQFMALQRIAFDQLSDPFSRQAALQAMGAYGNLFNSQNNAMTQGFKNAADQRELQQKALLDQRNYNDAAPMRGLQSEQANLDLGVIRGDQEAIKKKKALTALTSERKPLVLSSKTRDDLGNLFENQVAYDPVTYKPIAGNMLDQKTISEISSRNTPEYQSEFARLKQTYPDASDEKIHAYLSQR